MQMPHSISTETFLFWQSRLSVYSFDLPVNLRILDHIPRQNNSVLKGKVLHFIKLKITVDFALNGHDLLFID